ALDDYETSVVLWAERERHRPGKKSGGMPIAKWRTFRQTDRILGRPKGQSERSSAISERSLDAGVQTGFFDPDIHMTILITGQQVTRPDHTPLVCFAAQNHQATHLSPRLFAKAGEHAVAGEKKILTEHIRKSGGPQFVRPHHRYGQK